MSGGKLDARSAMVLVLEAFMEIAGMAPDKSPTEKAEEIQGQASELDGELRQSLPISPGFPAYNGGVLVLGKFYAQSRRIYFGLNPGGEGTEFKAAPNFHTDLNPPFDFPSEKDGDYAYWVAAYVCSHPTGAGHLPQRIKFDLRPERVSRFRAQWW